MMQKTTHVFPIIGGRKVEQLEANIEALSVALSDEQIKYLEDVLPFVRGFPHDMIVSLVPQCSLLCTHGRGYRATGRAMGPCSQWAVTSIAGRVLRR